MRPAAVPRSPRLSEEDKAKRRRQRLISTILRNFRELTKRERRRVVAQLLEILG